MPSNIPDLLTPGEVAKLYKCDPKTVSRWAKDGRFSDIDLPGFHGSVVVRTPGGHRRFYKAGIDALMAASEEDQ